MHEYQSTGVNLRDETPPWASKIGINLIIGIDIGFLGVSSPAIAVAGGEAEPYTQLPCRSHRPPNSLGLKTKLKRCLTGSCGSCGFTGNSGEIDPLKQRW